MWLNSTSHWPQSKRHISPEGAAQLAPLLGEGTSRGIALVFLIAGIIMITAALLAFLTPVYRRVSASYKRAAAEYE